MRDTKHTDVKLEGKTNGSRVFICVSGAFLNFNTQAMRVKLCVFKSDLNFSEDICLIHPLHSVF